MNLKLKIRCQIEETNRLIGEHNKRWDKLVLISKIISYFFFALSIFLIEFVGWSGVFGFGWSFLFLMESFDCIAKKNEFTKEMLEIRQHAYDLLNEA